MVGTTFRVPNDRKRGAEIDHHLRCHFAGIGSLRKRRDVLHTPHDPAACQQRLSLREIRARHTDTHAHISRQFTRALRHRLQQRCVFGEAPVHLPVTDYQLGSLFRHRLVVSSS